MNTTRDNIEIDIWVEDFLSGLLSASGLDVWIDEMDVDQKVGAIEIQLDGPDKARAIGRDGQTLESIQHLLVSAAANAGVSRMRIVVDVGGYRKRRDDKVREEAQRLAERTAETGTPHELEPMSARERRIVHMVAAGIDGVTSESEGTGSERFVRLVPSA